MFKRVWMAMTIGLLALAGCTHDYGKDRPPIDELDSRDKGLQSKDVIVAADQMSMDLLALPELNAADHRWLIVVDHVENKTTSNRFDMDIFLENLRMKLGQHGKGRVQLIENRDKLRDLQSRELEQGGDEFGQGGGKKSPGPAGRQPDFSLYARIMEMPNRGTSYYFCEFTLTDLRTREQVWTNAYQVKVAR